MNTSNATSRVGAATAAACILILLVPGCIVNSDPTPGDAGGSAASGTASDSTGGGPSSGGETAMPAPVDCSEIESRDACLAAPDFELFPHLDDGPLGSCSWEPQYRVVDLLTCELQQDGGRCLHPSSDDGCEGLEGLACTDDLGAGYVVGEDDSVRVGVGSSTCYIGVLSPCVDDDSPPECACACAVAGLQE